MDDMCILSSCLDLHVIAIDGKLIPMSKLFIIGNYCVHVVDSKHEAKHHAVMMDNSHTFFAQ